MSNDVETAVAELVPHGSNLATVDRAEIDMQIATAKQYPRSVATCIDNARALIKMDKESARQAFYCLDFYDKKNPVIGPSIRMAEIIASQWKNIRYGSRPLEVTDTTVVAQGYCYDLENNVAFTATKTKPILDKYGKRYKADLIVKIMLAAQAIAERDAILKVVPRAFANSLVEEAMSVAEGSEKTTEERQADTISYFGKIGVTPEALCAFLEISDPRDMTLRHMTILRGVANSIKDGIITIKDVFYPEPKAEEPAAKETTGTSKMDALAERLSPKQPDPEMDGAPAPAPLAPTRNDLLLAVTKSVEAKGLNASTFDRLVAECGEGTYDRFTMEQLEHLLLLLDAHEGEPVAEPDSSTTTEPIPPLLQTGVKKRNA